MLSVIKIFITQRLLNELIIDYSQFINFCYIQFNTPYLIDKSYFYRMSYIII